MFINIPLQLPHMCFPCGNFISVSEILKPATETGNVTLFSLEYTIPDVYVISFSLYQPHDDSNCGFSSGNPPH